MRRTAIVGAGFCGAMACVHLLRRGERVLLVERRARFGPGLAYADTRARVPPLLNVPAALMSAFPDDPDHFVRFIARRDPTMRANTFAPRALYGAYLEGVLADAEARAGEGALVRAERSAVSLRVDEGGTIRVGFGGGGEARAERAILALGNHPPRALPFPVAARGDGATRIVRDPWAEGALAFGPRGDVLLVGTGLTMMDVALALGPREGGATIHAVSRRGLLPQAHRVLARAPALLDPPTALPAWPRTTRGLLAALRAEVRDAEKRGVDWREVMTSLRGVTPSLWRSLPERERARFLRHARPHWETHRHRAPPENAPVVAAMIARGELAVTAARVLACDASAAGVDVHWRERRSGAERRLRVAHVVNCTGPELDPRRVDEPLLRQMIAEGVVRPDAHGLGIDTDAEGRVLSAAGRAHPTLFTLGSLRKGGLWESTAVQELRQQAADLAARLC